MGRAHIVLRHVLPDRFLRPSLLRRCVAMSLGPSQAEGTIVPFVNAEKWQYAHSGVQIAGISGSLQRSEPSGSIDRIPVRILNSVALTQRFSFAEF